MRKYLKRLDLSLITQLLLSEVLMIMGVVIMIFKTFGLRELILYVALLFYIYAFFSIIAYFIGRRKGDYEILLTSLINVVVATFLYLFRDSEISVILGAAMLIYTILLVANRSYKILSLKKQDSYMRIIKFIVTFLIAFLGILVSINLYKEKTVQTMLFGYYFISLGFLMTLENIIEIFITEDKFKKLLIKVIEEDKPLEVIKEDKKENIEIKEKVELNDKEDVKVLPKKVKTTKTSKPKKESIKKEEKKVVKPAKKETTKKVVKTSKNVKPKTKKEADKKEKTKTVNVTKKENVKKVVKKSVSKESKKVIKKEIPESEKKKVKETKKAIKKPATKVVKETKKVTKKPSTEKTKAVKTAKPKKNTKEVK